jgi:hypothetical protein
VSEKLLHYRGRELKTMRVAAKEWYRVSGKQKGRKYFENYYQNNGKPWFQRLSFRRKSVVSINRLGSGHYCLKSALFHLLSLIKKCLDVTKPKKL